MCPSPQPTEAKLVEQISKIHESHKKITEAGAKHDSLKSDYKYEDSKLQIAAKEYREARLAAADEMKVPDDTKAKLKEGIVQACNSIDEGMKGQYSSWIGDAAPDFKKGQWDNIFSRAEGKIRDSVAEVKDAKPEDQKEIDKFANQSVAEMPEVKNKLSETLTELERSVSNKASLNSSLQIALEISKEDHYTAKQIFKALNDKSVLNEDNFIASVGFDDVNALARIKALRESDQTIFQSEKFPNLTFQCNKDNSVSMSPVAVGDNVMWNWDKKEFKAGIEGLFEFLGQKLALPKGSEVVITYHNPEKLLSKNQLQLVLIALQVANEKGYLAELDPATKSHFINLRSNEKSIMGLAKVGKLIDEIFAAEQVMTDKVNSSAKFTKYSGAANKAVASYKNPERKDRLDGLIAEINQAHQVPAAGSAPVNQAQERKNFIESINVENIFFKAGAGVEYVELNKPPQSAEKEGKKAVHLIELAKEIKDRQTEVKQHYNLLTEQLNKLPEMSLKSQALSDHTEVLKNLLDNVKNELQALDAQAGVWLNEAKTITFADLKEEVREQLISAETETEKVEQDVGILREGVDEDVNPDAKLGKDMSDLVAHTERTQAAEAAPRAGL